MPEWQEDVQLIREVLESRSDDGSMPFSGPRLVGWHEAIEALGRLEARIKREEYLTGIHLGMPVRCYGERMQGANWFADAVLTLLLPIFGFNGYVMIYEGSYWRALWHWLFDGDFEDE